VCASGCRNPGIAIIREDNPLRLEMLVFFGSAGEEKRVCNSGLAMGDLGDDIAAAKPVGLREVSGRPLRGVVGVRVIEAGDFEALAAGLALNADKLDWRNLVAVVS
jgi:hypothetical protein